jgi:hypothetical protein
MTLVGEYEHKSTMDAPTHHTFQPRLFRRDGYIFLSNEFISYSTSLYEWLFLQIKLIFSKIW